MMRLLSYITSVLLLLSCKRDFEAPIPDSDWDLFQSSAAVAAPPTIRPKTEGIYTVSEDGGLFGPEVAAHWSYTVTGTDTTWKLSFFGSTAGTYAVCEGKRLDTLLLLDGYYRRALTTETGRVQLTVGTSGGSAYLFSTSPPNPNSNLTITGNVISLAPGTNTTIRLSLDRPLNTAPFEVVAHRGGGRTSDLLPASENSVEMILLAAQFGATGIEIDVQLTKDGIPVLYHDATLNERTIIKNGMIGPIKDYNWTQLESLVRLKRGGRIPTLKEALEAALYRTPIRYVWLDTKYNGSLEAMRQLQTEFMQRAATLGKPFEISIGIPDAEAFNNFKRLNNYQQVPSVNELSKDRVEEVNSRIWAPQWTLGLQNDAVLAMKAQGRRVFTWTMDIPANIDQYLDQGHFDGILSNYPSLVAYYHYAKQ